MGSAILATRLAGLAAAFVVLTGCGAHINGESGPPDATAAGPGDGSATPDTTPYVEADGSNVTLPTSCSPSSPPPVAPGGYFVNGDTICAADGTPHLFHGVVQPSLEWTSVGDHFSADDFRLMADTWKANVVELYLNQDFWLSGSPRYDAMYSTRIAQAVHDAEQAGMDVILTLLWSDAGNLDGGTQNNGQHEMPDANSIAFWRDVATAYQDDGRVLFELYGEPHDVSVSVWRDGGPTSTGWTAVGMQQVYDTVRGAGANNIVIVNGLSYGYDLSFVPGSRLQGYNIAYGTAPYWASPDKQPSSWDSAWGLVTKSDPVFVTEFGDNGTNCSGDFDAALIEYADRSKASWIAFAWYVAGACSFPSLLKDWNGSPTSQGAVVQAALLRYH
jgi:hypothetical protein